MKGFFTKNGFTRKVLKLIRGIKSLKVKETLILKKPVKKIEEVKNVNINEKLKKFFEDIEKRDDLNLYERDIQEMNYISDLFGANFNLIIGYMHERCFKEDFIKMIEFRLCDWHNQLMYFTIHQEYEID